MPEKASITHQFIARGLDQTSAVHNIEIGRSETMYNFDTDAHGFISKRKGYSLHRNIPIRITNVGDRGDNWEFVAHPSIDLLGVPSGPVVVNGQALDDQGTLQPVSFYWNTFENLGAFSINANNVDEGVVTDPDGIYRSEVTVSHSDDFNLLIGILQQDMQFSENNKAILTDDIINVQKSDGSFELDLLFESPEDFGDNRYTVFKPDTSIIQNQFYSQRFVVTKNENLIVIPQSTHLLSGENYIIQVWAEKPTTGSNLEERKIIIPDSIVIQNNEDVQIQLTVPQGITEFVYVNMIAVNSGFQQAALIPESTDIDDDQFLCLTNVTTNVNLWSLYRVAPDGTQTLVLPDEVEYVGQNVGAMPDEVCDASQPPLSLRFKFNTLNTDAATYKAVYAPCVPVNAGILVPKLTNGIIQTNPIQFLDTTNFDLENADLILHGIDWSGVVVNPLRSEFAYVREVEEYNSTVFKRLVAVCSGDFWIEDLDTTYTLTASQSGEQKDERQYLSPYFGVSDNALNDDRNRGLQADEIANHKVEIESITNNGDGTAVVVCSELTNIQGDLSGLVVNIDKLTIEGDENNVYNGSHTITKATLVLDETDFSTGVLTFTIQVENLKAYSPSSANSSAVCGIFTDYILVNEDTYSTFQVDDIINNISGILGSKVFALQDLTRRIWIDVVPQEVFLPGSVSITWDRITDTIVVDTLDQAVPFDIVNVSGFVRKFKIVEIDVANMAIKLNESIQVSNFFGNATTITLDGRLSLPLKPDKNIVKDFPFSPTGEYNAELAALNDSLYTSTYDRSVVKFDGTHLSDAGILEYPVYSHSWIVPKVLGVNENDFGFINPDSVAAKVSAVVADDSITIILTDSISSTLFLKDKVSLESADGQTIVDLTVNDIDRDTDTLILKTDGSMGSTTNFAMDDIVSLFQPTSFGYYFRIEYTDRNNRIITGTPNSYIDAIVTITRPSLIMHSLKLPTTSKGTTEWDRFKIGIYRTLGADSVSNVTPIFFKVDDTPALKNLTGSKASDAQAIHTVVIADTTSDGSLAPGKNNEIIRSELQSGVNSGTDFISNAQISSLGGSAVERPIAAARPPQAQYLLSTNGHMVYGNIRSNSSLLTTWTKNKSGIKNIAGSKVTLKSESEFSNYDIPVKFVDTGEQDIISIQKSDAATASDFIDSENESGNVGFLKLEISGTIPASEGSYIQIISKDVSTSNTENDFVGSLIGWHKITKIDGNFLFIRVPSFIADEFPDLSSLTVDSIQAVFLGGNEVTDFEFNAISEDEIDVDGEGKYVTLFSANDETSYVFWFSVNGGINFQTPPDIPESEVVEVNVLFGSSGEDIAMAFAEQVMGYEDFIVEQDLTTVTITNAIEGPSTDATAGTFTDPSVGVTVTVTSQGEFAIPCWDKDYADDFPSQDITLPNNSSQRNIRNWAKAINTVMADNAYYTRITEELGLSPVASLSSFNNIILGDWAYCKWGQTVGGNNIEIVQQTSDSIQFYIETENLPDGFAIFSDGFISSNPIFAQPKVFPSRLVVSYRNYPESVDNPYADDQIKSFSAIDINASDGEEITGMATFFSESATGGAQYAGTVIVFKTSSVYAVDISTKQTQRLQSMGQGCTVPDSIASTDDTIFFANDTGVYKVTRDLNVKYVGDVLERYYDALPKGTLRTRGYGIADNFDLNYQLAVPVTSTVNQEIAVYNFESMSKQAEGSWALYDSIPLSSAKQTSTRFFFGNFKGRIWEKRNAGDNSDYRDDDSAISATFTYGPQHFGDPGKTKDMSHTIVQYAGNGPSAATVGMALDLSDDFTTLDPTNAGEGNWKGINVAYSPPPAKAVFYQIRVQHDVKDEPCVVNGFVFKVSIGNEQAIRQAADGANGAKK